jgi:PAS domain S-box-containing protein
MPNASVDHLSLFEQIYSHVPFGIALLSIDGSCIKVNPAFCRIIGYTEEELGAMSFLETGHPDDREETSLLFA